MSGAGGSLLGGFDFRAIEEMDPSIADGYRIIYDRDVPFELRLQEGSGALEAIKVKARPAMHAACAHTTLCLNGVAKHPQILTLPCTGGRTVGPAPHCAILV